MWLHIVYEPVSAFSLRPSNTTSTGGKSLVCPTPYAMKMALLDRLLRFYGETYGQEHFYEIRDLRFFLKLPLATSVNRTFQKILRPGGTGVIWNSTISQREFCFQTGQMELLTWVENPVFADVLRVLFGAINYFGRRGGFFQYVSSEIVAEIETIPASFADISWQRATNTALGFGLLQRMDDMVADADFEQVSLFSGKSSNNGGRTSYTVMLPYQLVHHGRNHSVYQRQVEYDTD